MLNKIRQISNNLIMYINNSKAEQGLKENNFF